AHAVVAPLLEELGTAEDVHPLAVREIEPECVEAPALHRDADACAVAWILEGEVDGGPTVMALQLGDLALHPERRQLAQPLRDAAVEARDGVDRAIVVRERCDLRHGCQRTGTRRRGRAVR